MSPASDAPCTLFCPLSGCSPVPGRPTWPHISANEIRQRELSVPWICWLTPIPQKIIPDFEVAKVRATSRITSGAMPETASIASGVKSARWAFSASQFSVKAAMYCSSKRPSSTITFMIEFSIATSAPGRNCSI